MKKINLVPGEITIFLVRENAMPQENRHLNAQKIAHIDRIRRFLQLICELIGNCSIFLRISLHISAGKVGIYEKSNNKASTIKYRSTKETHPVCTPGKFSPKPISGSFCAVMIGFTRMTLKSK